MRVSGAGGDGDTPGETCHLMSVKTSDACQGDGQAAQRWRGLHSRLRLLRDESDPEAHTEGSHLLICGPGDQVNTRAVRQSMHLLFLRRIKLNNARNALEPIDRPGALGACCYRNRLLVSGGQWGHRAVYRDLSPGQSHSADPALLWWVCCCVRQRLDIRGKMLQP